MFRDYFRKAGICLTAFVLACSCFLFPAPGIGESAPVTPETAGSADLSVPEAAQASPDSSEKAADSESAADLEAPSGDVTGYVLITLSRQTGWLPVPEKGEYTYPLIQYSEDGSTAENVIHITAEGVYMESANCENHDCVKQGMVTFENRADRILGNMIICLPNEVTLELYTVEEFEALLADQQGN